MTGLYRSRGVVVSGRTSGRRIRAGHPPSCRSSAAVISDTAAAIGGLKILDQVPDALRTDVAEFLVGMQTSEGGLRANTRIPIADLLSSFTGLFTLVELGEQDRLQLDQLAHFVSQLAENDSGFCAALWDTDTDVEYTFYGLGSLALLATLGKFDCIKEASHHR